MGLSSLWNIVSRNQLTIYNILNFFSLIQFKLQKIYNYPSVVRIRNWVYTQFRPSEVTVILNNECIKHKTLKQIQTEVDLSYNYDLIIYSDYSLQDSIKTRILRTNKAIFYNMKNLFIYLKMNLNFPSRIQSSSIEI